MRKLIPLCTLLAVCGCQQNIVVPTTKELIDDRQLLADWQSKCDTGEYSHLPADRKANLCSTTQEATISVAQMASGKKESDFFKANTLRK